MGNRFVEVRRIQINDKTMGIIKRITDGREFHWEAPICKDPMLTIHLLIAQLEKDYDTG